MSITAIAGVDHVVVAVRDLDAAIAAWGALGFKIAPRGTHSPHIGTGNATIMLDNDYIELLGVLAPTDNNAPTRAFLATREGIERTAFTASDAGRLAGELKVAGLAAIGPLSFSRPVRRADGITAEARFETVLWPLDEQPGGMRLFACQHLTRENVWLPELLGHANGARRIARIELLARDPGAAAAHMARLSGLTAVADAEGAHRVSTGHGRADFLFLDRVTLARRYPGVTIDDLPSEGAVVLALKADEGPGYNALGAYPGAIIRPNRLIIPAMSANGVILVLETA